MDENNSHLQKEIATSFSNGDFDFVFPYLSHNIIWTVIGTNKFIGKSEVVANCKQTTEYFKSVQTKFKTEDIIVTNQKVIVRGTAEFLSNGKRLNYILACDVYEFNDNNELETISSYCNPEKD